MVMLRATIIGLAALAVILTGTWLYLADSAHDRGGAEIAAPGSDIGGHFELVNGDGATVTEQDFAGRFMLIYFGYTYCPDVCPTELQVMASALDRLAPEVAERIVPVFISIDPERDTPEVVGDYVALFHPRMVGLTGSERQVSQAAKAWRVYYSKVEDPEASDYLMNHSSFIYLMGPDGGLLTIYRHDATAGQIAESLRNYVDARS
jgi:protein SCO1/2